jgi:hypothetical protein
MELRKGYFPHTFMTLQRYLDNHLGPLPDREYFQPHKFDKGERNADGTLKETRSHTREGFEAWFAERNASGEPWDLRKEMEAYCWDDVEVLRQLLLKLATDAAELGIVNPLTCTTRAGVAFRTFRQIYLKEKSIPLLRCMPRLVDQPGIGPGADEEGLCRSAYTGGKTMTSCVLYELTEEQQLRGMRIVMDDVVSMYPSVMLEGRFPNGDFKFRAWTLSLQNSDQLKEILASHEGIICGEFFLPSDKEPILHPLLPSRRKNRPESHSDPSKLVFSLDLPPVSKTDIQHWEDHHNEIIRDLSHALKCTHTRENCPDCSAFERCPCFDVHPRVFGDSRPAYCMPSVRFALENGYEIRHIYWTLTTSEYSTELFTDYVKQFYRVKHKYKGANEALIQKLSDPLFAAQYALDHFIDLPEGGTLEKYHDKRPGRSTEGKLMLNTLYGRFGMRGGKDEMFNSIGQDDEESLWERFNTGELKFKDQAVHQNVTVYRATSANPGSAIATTAVYIAAYVTAYAQIVLAKKLNLHGFNALYCDTDSCVIVYDCPKNQEAPTGKLLGNWEREDKVGECHGFVSMGQKIYALMGWVEANGEEKGVLLGKFGMSEEELLGADPDWRKERVQASSDGVFDWRCGKIMKMVTKKLKVKGVSMKTDNNSELLTYLSMKKAVQGMLGIGEEKDQRVVMRDERFIWNREMSRFFFEKGRKIVGASVSELKGDLGGPNGTYVMPFGWKRFWWREFESREEFEERVHANGWTRDMLDTLTPKQLAEAKVHYPIDELMDDVDD